MKELKEVLEEGIKLLSKYEDINIKSDAFGLLVQLNRIKDNRIEPSELKPTKEENQIADIEEKYNELIIELKRLLAR